MQEAGAGEVQGMLDEYFDKRTGGGEAGVDTGDAFLRQFLVKRLWDDEGDRERAVRGDDDEDGDKDVRGGRGLAHGAARINVDVPVGVDEDEDFLDQADDFERQYNFRCASCTGFVRQAFRFPGKLSVFSVGPLTVWGPMTKNHTLGYGA